LRKSVRDYLRSSYVICFEFAYVRCGLHVPRPVQGSDFFIQVCVNTGVVTAGDRSDQIGSTGGRGDEGGLGVAGERLTDRGERGCRDCEPEYGLDVVAEQYRVELTVEIANSGAHQLFRAAFDG
jgi:hypothetical protein